MFARKRFRSMAGMATRKTIRPKSTGATRSWAPLAKARRKYNASSLPVRFCSRLFEWEPWSGIGMTEEVNTITLPVRLSFVHDGVYDFDHYLDLFDWTLRNTQVQIDFRQCKNANYQALSLFVLYVWHLKKQGCHV